MMRPNWLSGKDYLRRIMQFVLGYLIRFDILFSKRPWTFVAINTFGLEENYQSSFSFYGKQFEFLHLKFVAYFFLYKIEFQLKWHIFFVLFCNLCTSVLILLIITIYWQVSFIFYTRITIYISLFDVFMFSYIWNIFRRQVSLIKSLECFCF